MIQTGRNRANNGPKNAYKWSRDYERLRQLLDEGYEVVCLVDYSIWNCKDSIVARDICRARKTENDTPPYLRYSFSSRGRVYGEIDLGMLLGKPFGYFAKAWGVEFIDISEENGQDKTTNNKRT